MVLVFVIARLWGLDLRDLASQGVGAQFAGALVEVFLIGIVAYGLWELLEIMADRARSRSSARPLASTARGGEEQFEGEGGQGGTRLGTIMPLVRRIGQVIILALALLAVLGQIGVNITPLLAGAGIVGLGGGLRRPGAGQGHHLGGVLSSSTTPSARASTSTSARSRARWRASRSAPCSYATTTGR